MNGTHRIVPFDVDAPPPPGVLARLHSELLPHSPLTKLGREFMERFYYAVLPRDGVIFGAIAYVGEDPAGFVVATHDSAGFMKETLRRHWTKIPTALLSSLFAAPSRVLSVWEALQIMRSRGDAKSSERASEILSIGILPEFRQSSAHPKVQLATELLSTAVSRLLENGAPLIRAIVDEDNAPAHSFYSARGWTMESTKVPGWPVPSVEFVFRPKLTGPDDIPSRENDGHEGDLSPPRIPAETEVFSESKLSLQTER